MKPKFQNIQKSAKLEDNRKALRFSVKEIEGSPSFSFNHFSEKGYGIGDCRLDDYGYMIKKLKTLGKSDWNTINNSARHGLGFEKIDKKILNAKLPSDVPEDVKLYAFRYNGKKPMVGYREGDVFHIIFLDIDFSLYDHS